MKKYDLIKLKNATAYKEYNLKKDMHGIVISVDIPQLEILFFNPNNIGDYIVAKIHSNDVLLEKEQLPRELLNKLNEKIEQLKSKSKKKIEPLKIKAYDMVELLVEDNKYAKFGIHKGDVGCVMEDNAVQDYIEVDFSGIDQDGNCYGDCISVKIEDLKVLYE